MFHCTLLQLTTSSEISPTPLKRRLFYARHIWREGEFLMLANPLELATLKNAIAFKSNFSYNA